MPYASKRLIFSVPARARTVDPLIKSQLLYQLSYRDRFPCVGRAKLGKIWKRKCNWRKKMLVGSLADRIYPPACFGEAAGSLSSGYRR
jgi:hypothetical protein